MITKECISFAFIRKEEEIDRIPLDGVDFVKAHFEAAVTDANDLRAHDRQSQDFFCFQVGTSAEGYNSGRTYTLRTDSKRLYDEILPLLTKLSKKARRRAEAHTLFQKCQRKVRKIYSHNFCQSFIALIIMGVSIQFFVSLRIAFPPMCESYRAELRVHHRRGAVQPVPVQQREPLPAPR